jgi:HAD superfamily hydrolase (TIGR01549 family)
MKKSLQKYLKSSGKTHLLFDFDETIVKLVLPWDEIFDEISKNLTALDKTIYERFKKKEISVNQLGNEYILKFGNKVKKPLIDSQAQFEKESLQGYLKNDAMIDFIKNDTEYKMLIWSSNTKPTVKKVLQGLGLLNKFQTIVSREDVALSKPYIDGFKKLYERRVPKNKYLFIGDSKNDQKAADEIGIDFYLEDYFNIPGKYW